MKIGFIGLGNIGSKLASSLLRNGKDVTVHDLNHAAAQPLITQGAGWADSPREMAALCDVVITCLPSPAASRAVMTAEDGLLAAMSAGKIWLEMSTTDEVEVKALGKLVVERGGRPVDCPVSGGCHRADTGNISIFAGCSRETFELVLPLLTTMGRRILHTGALGSASILKVVTNYLATVNLVSVAEALMVSKLANMDLNIAFEAIAISSGTSFVHETEGQMILSGSRDVSFTMDLVLKDTGLFQEVANRAGIKLELSPLIVDIFKDGVAKYGARELSPNIIRRLEDQMGERVLAPGFPTEMLDTEPEVPGYEVTPQDRSQTGGALNI